MERVREFFRSFGDFYDLPDVEDLMPEMRATPEPRSMPLLHPPNLREAYAEIAALQEKVRVLEEELKKAGITPPILYPWVRI